MVRNVIGSVLALIGATAAVLSPFRAWYDGRPGRDYRVADLFTGITATKAGLATSILLPLAFAALVTLIGLLLRSRLLVALAGLVVLGFTVLWMIRQGQAVGSLSVESDGSGLGPGVGAAAGGGILLLLAAVLMSGRRRGEGRRFGRRRRVDGEPEVYGEGYGDGHGRPYPHQPYTGHPGGDAPTAEYPRHDPADGRRPDDGYGYGYGQEGPRGPEDQGPPRR
ncbi:hypothetical protein QWM81_02750 [Streptomyces ficellus]|uniref:Uncharacterized protein n=1 Tax=Streptomyces ficellus TaxID=1977088 RepID=A0ABT7Z0H8_9ACTN|nr:hypothetical protein [Streptomyces ficellus]MDN3292985.1 hypothetical protein [Streptomyces ficellus]